MPTTKNNKNSNMYEETRLSMSTENYLLSIFRLQEQQPRLSLTQLADHLKTLPEAEGLGTSLPSVSAMIRRMVREGLVESDHKKGIILTNNGNQSGIEGPFVICTPEPDYQGKKWKGI